MYRLIVAEKPSVAASIARVVGAKNREDGYYSGASDLVTYCLGHLATLAEPADYDAKYKKWRMEDLPILPDTYLTVPIASSKKQFEVVQKLMRRRDVDSIVCATDCAREGELIFRRVYDLSGVSKPVFRLWVSSSEDSAYRAGLDNLRPEREYENLYQSGYARSVADWLIGMNYSRAYTCLYNSHLFVGRVKTPVLGFLVSREQEIRNHVPKPYFSIKASFGDYYGTARTEDTASAKALEALVGHEAVIRESVSEDKVEQPPLLFNTTDIMKWSNKALGLSAADTLEILQKLYDDKLVTYPRVESKYLTGDMAAPALRRARLLAERLQNEKYALAKGLRDAVPDRLINDKESEEHYALLPTETAANTDHIDLSGNARAIYYAIVFRLLAALGSPSRSKKQHVVTVVDGEYVFSSSGTHENEAGYKMYDRALSEVIFQKTTADPDDENDAEKEQELPALSQGDTRTVVSVSTKEMQTKPPKRYTEVICYERGIRNRP